MARLANRAYAASFVALVCALISGGGTGSRPVAEKHLQPFTDRPGPVFLGANPCRDPITRGGRWSSRTLRDLARIERADLRELPLGFYGVGWGLQFGDEGGSGGGGSSPGEGYSGGGGPSGFAGAQGEAECGGSSGSMLNTNTGNRLVWYSLVSWMDRAGCTVEFTIFHNSISSYDSEIGFGASHSYDIHLDYTPNSSAIVRWPDGMLHPYSEIAPGEFAAPGGVYDRLIRNSDGTWTLTTHDQDQYRFTTCDGSGRAVCNAILDRFGNQITINLNANRKATSVVDCSGRALTFSYSGSRISSMTDPTGRTWSFSYDSAGNLQSIAYPAIGGVVKTRTFAYDSAHNMTRETDLRGNDWTMTYDQYSRITGWKDPNLNQTTVAYNYSSTVITSPSGHTLTHNYSMGTLASTVDSAGFSDSFIWSSGFNLVQYTDKRGKLWQYSYDSNGNRVMFKNPLLKATTYTYNAANDLTSVTDPLGNTTSFSYFPSGALKTVSDGMGRRVVECAYDAYGQLCSVKDAYDHTWTLTRNLKGEVVYATDAGGNSYSAAYDPLSRMTSLTTPTGAVYSAEYDAWGRPWKFVNPDGTFLTVQLDGESNITSVTDELGCVSTFAYDAAMRLIDANNANSENTHFTYNNDSLLSAIRNGRGFTRTFTYNVRGEIVRQDYADGSYEAWSFNGNGDVSAHTNGLGQTIGFVYDDASRLTAVDYPTGVDTGFVYDAADQLVQMTDASGTTNWTHNAAGDVMSISYGSASIAYQYDLAGRVSSCTIAGIGTVSWSHDALGRLASITNPFGETTTLAYDADSRLVRRTCSNGTCEAFEYDINSRISKIWLNNSLDEHLKAIEYAYDAAGRPIQKSEDGVCKNYTYDPADRLLSETAPGYACTYSYDANGNRLTKTLNGATDSYAYDAADKLLSITGANNRSFAYDAAGRTASITQAGVTTSFAYDYDDRIVQVSRSGMTTNASVYNAFGARVGLSDSHGSRSFVRNGADVCAPILSDGSAVYTPGVSERRNGVSTFTACGVKDGYAQTNGSQTVVAANQYDAFGNLIGAAGSWSGPFGYGSAFGYESDSDTGLQHLGYRFYDPSIGRFITRDPAQMGGNWYAYCGNNPLLSADPLGLWDFPGWWISLGEWVDEHIFSGATENFGRVAGEYDCGTANGFQYFCAASWFAFELGSNGVSMGTVGAVRGGLKSITMDTVKNMIVRRGGETAHTIAGRAIHKALEKICESKGWKVGKDAHIRDKNGRLLKPDAIVNGHPVEFKPNTPSGRAKGKAQLKKYEEATRKKGRLVLYDK